jgi:membrane protein YdbS with pleckstrin-like domain
VRVKLPAGWWWTGLVPGQPMADHGPVTQPTQRRRHAGPPGRALALLLLVTACIVGLFAVGLWMLAFAPERWQRVVGVVIAFVATIQMAAVPFLWRAWRAQHDTDPARRR